MSMLQSLYPYSQTPLVLYRSAAATIASSFFFTDEEKLDLDKRNFKTWKIALEDALVVASPLDLFVMGPVPAQPNKEDKPEGYGSWVSNDRLARVLLRRTLSQKEIRAVEDAQTANEMWTKIFQRHCTPAVVTKADLFSKALQTLSASRPLSTESVEKAKGLLRLIYEKDHPSFDDLIFMMTMCVTGSDYGVIRSSYLDSVAASGESTLDSLIACIQRATLQPQPTVEDIYLVPAPFRDYSITEFHSDAILAVETDWAQVEVLTEGVTLRASTVDCRNHEKIEWSPSRIKWSNGRYKFAQIQVACVTTKASWVTNF
jgi:hypothetical protein